MAKVAILKFNSLDGSRVDREKGIVYGVQLAKLGKKATFKALDGKKTAINITAGVVSGLLALFSANEQTTSHWTHTWIENGEDGLASKVATFRNFRKGDNGDLLADAFLWPTDHKEAILHAAENDPTGMMISTVFDYTGGENDAVPTRVHAADFVEVGASTTALCAKLSEDNSTSNSMITIDDLKTLLDDPAAKALIRGCIDAHDDMASDAESAALEADAGVTDADKKDSDSQSPALMRAALRIARSISRQTKALAADKVAILAEAKVQAGAETTALLGKGGFLKPGTGEQNGDEYTALLSKYTETANGNRVLAAQRLVKDRPDLSPAHDEAMRLRMEKFATGKTIS